jgi:ribosomal protein L9
MLTAKADDQGHLYKKIHTGDIAAILKDEHDISLHDEQILLDEPIHEVGDHEVPIEAAGEKVTVTVQVVAE